MRVAGATANVKTFKCTAHCCETTCRKDTRSRALVGVQLVLEGGGGDGLLARDAAGGPPHHVAHVDDRGDELLAALPFWRLLLPRM